MLHIDDPAMLVDQRVLLIFQTTHFDKAGETGLHRSVLAELIALDMAGEALLITKDDLHLRFPAHALHPVTAAPKPWQEVMTKAGAVFLGGQEVVRDFHNAVSPVRLGFLRLEDIARLTAVRPTK